MPTSYQNREGLFTIMMTRKILILSVVLGLVCALSVAAQRIRKHGALLDVSRTGSVVIEPRTGQSVTLGKTTDRNIVFVNPTWTGLGDYNNNYNGTFIEIADADKRIGIVSQGGPISIGSEHLGNDTFMGVTDSLKTIVMQTTGLVRIGDWHSYGNDTALYVNDEARTISHNAANGTVINGGVQLTGAAQPTCNIGNRFKFWTVAGADGVQDSVAVCAKGADNVYAWRTIY